MPKRGKLYRAMQAQVDRNKNYQSTDALDLLKKASYAKFDGKDLSMNLWEKDV